jgi:hypothetical protein
MNDISITFTSPQELLAERSKLVKESIELMRRQSRSNQKYAQKMNRIMNKLIKLERQMGVM